MREVPVPTGIAAPPCRHAIALIAALLVVLQVFLAGVATAQAAAMLAAPAAIDVICHGSGNGGGASDSTAPETAKIEHLCCVACTAAAPGLPPPAAPGLAEVRQIPRPAIISSFTFVISPGAIRAGLSQAPPSLA
jgi:DUF2946 family protein